MKSHWDFLHRFWNISYFKHITLIFTDYYILENNSLLKAALKYKRIQLTDFRTVPIEHFGENKVLAFCSDTVNHRWLAGELHDIFFKFFFTDLPLKISYPPDFSDSRLYGLLLVVYVPEHMWWHRACVHCRTTCISYNMNFFISWG